MGVCGLERKTVSLEDPGYLAVCSSTLVPLMEAKEPGEKGLTHHMRVFQEQCPDETIYIDFRVDTLWVHGPKSLQSFAVNQNPSFWANEKENLEMVKRFKGIRYLAYDPTMLGYYQTWKHHIHDLIAAFHDLEILYVTCPTTEQDIQLTNVPSSNLASGFNSEPLEYSHIRHAYKRREELFCVKADIRLRALEQRQMWKQCGHTDEGPRIPLIIFLNQEQLFELMVDREKETKNLLGTSL